MTLLRCFNRRSRVRLLGSVCALLSVDGLAATEPGLLFQLSADHGTVADFSAAGTPEPTFVSEVTVIPDGAKGPALSCGNTQRLAWRAPGNIYAQRGTLSFFWRSRYPVGPTEFPIFRVGYADHSSWDMVWLRIDYNGHGFDAFVTDASLARTRVSVTLPEFPAPSTWVHLALAWDETRGIRFYVDGRLAAKNETVAVYDAALDQFGPNSRIISPHNVQSDYNFTRGGDIDEIRIYDRMISDDNVATLARGEAPAPTPLPARDSAAAATRAEWLRRYGWDRGAPPELPAANTIVRKVEIHDAYDLKRWWWKANDGIRETTWPGVYNRSRLPGRNDYFQLPDWDCYTLSGKAITFTLPDEPWNHVEISGAAWGRVDRTDGAARVHLFDRPSGQEITVNQLTAPITGGKVTFTNVEQEEPIGEFEVLNVATGREPAGSTRLAYRIVPGDRREKLLEPLRGFIAGRFALDERAINMVQPADLPLPLLAYAFFPRLPIIHVFIPNAWDELSDGLDGIAIDLPAMHLKPTPGDAVEFNIQVKDPLWPLRNMLDFTFSAKSDEVHTLWLDLRDRLLPPGKALYFTVASSSPEFNELTLFGAGVRLVFKPREQARVEHEIDRFTQARDSYAMLVEEHPHSDKFALWVRFESDLQDLLRVNPDHVLGRQYAAVAMNAPKPPFVQPVPPAGVPLWAFRQVEALGRVKNFANWWIDHRQIENGEFGGGLSDDTDLTNLWPGIAFMGVEPEKLTDSIHRELEACYANGMFTRGLPTIQADELHSYEEGINALGQNLILDYGNPRQIERAMETARGIESITGINPAGHRHIRSSYYSGTRLAEDEPWGCAKAYSYLVLQPAQLLVDYNGNPSARKVLLELADGLLAHRHPDGEGGFTLPSAITFKTDADSTATRRYLPWPLFWNAWQWTGERRYLDPILDGGTSTLMGVNANVLDLLALRDIWGRRILSGETGRPTESRGADGRGAARVDTRRTTGSGYFAWQLSGDKKSLEKIYADQIEDMALGEYINTEGSLWSDRVGVPTNELQRARLGGVALARNATFPGHVVSWQFHAPATAQSLAILLPDATATAFTVIVFNLETTPVQADLTGWNVDPGRWEIIQGIDTNDDDLADQSLETRTAVFERTRSVELIFAPRAITVLTFKLKVPGTSYWQRPDLGLSPEDVTVAGREVRVTVHSLGSVPSPTSEVVVRDRAGRVVGRVALPAIAAPVDLLPKTVGVVVTLAEGATVEGGTVEIEPDRRFEEITARNNTVRLP